MSMAVKYGLMKKARDSAGGSSTGSSEATDCVGPECSGCDSAACMAEGGEVGGDLVNRIMKKRGSDMAGSKSADFDVMDDIEVPDDADYTGANSGDEIGNDTLDENDADLIRRIMRSRAKSDRNPRPA